MTIQVSANPDMICFHGVNVAKSLILDLLPPDQTPKNLAAFLMDLLSPATNTHAKFLEYAHYWYTEAHTIEETNTQKQYLEKSLTLMAVSAALGNYYAIGKLKNYLDEYKATYTDGRFPKNLLNMVERARAHLRHIEHDQIKAKKRITKYFSFPRIALYHAHRANYLEQQKIILLHAMFQQSGYRHFQLRYHRFEFLKDVIYDFFSKCHAAIHFKFLNRMIQWVRERIGGLVLGNAKSRTMLKRNLDKYVTQVDSLKKQGFLVEEYQVVNPEGNRIETLRIQHPKKDSFNPPTLIIFPGRSVNFAWGIQYFMSLANHAKCDVVVVNNRNISLRSVKSATRYDDLISDGEVVIQDLIKNKRIDEDTLTVYGHCNGGPTATGVALQLQKQGKTVKLITDRSFKSHAALIQAFLNAQYKKLEPKNKIIRIFLRILLLPVRLYLYFLSWRIGHFLTWTGWSHNQWADFQQLPPETKLALFIKPTPSEENEGILRDEGIPDGAGLYEEQLALEHDAIAKLVQLKSLLEAKGESLSGNTDNLKRLADCIQMIEKDISLLLSHRIYVSKETMKQFEKDHKKISPHNIYPHHLTVCDLNGKTQSIMEHIKQFVGLKISNLKNVKSDINWVSADEIPSMRDVRAQVEAITPQLYAIDRQRVALENQSAPEIKHDSFFDTVRPLMSC